MADKKPPREPTPHEKFRALAECVVNTPKAPKPPKDKDRRASA